MTFPISLDDQIAEVELELVSRARHYPKWVESGKLNQGIGDRRIAVLQEVLKSLRSLKDSNSSQASIIPIARPRRQRETSR